MADTQPKKEIKIEFRGGQMGLGENVKDLKMPPKNSKNIKLDNLEKLIKEGFNIDIPLEQNTKKMNKTMANNGIVSRSGIDRD